MSQSANQSTDNFTNPIYSNVGEKLYLSEIFADFYFTFDMGDGKYERAPVPAFKEFLQFFYLSRVKLTSNNVDKVMNLANKYNLADGLNICSKFIANTLTADDVCQGYGLAIIFGQERLQKFCEALITINTKAVFNSQTFLECNRDVLEHILMMDSLKCSEMDLFAACISWVKSSSSQDEVTKEIVHAELGDLMDKIRFGSMSPEQFGSLIPSYGDLFSVDEYKDIIQMITSKDYIPQSFTNDRRKRTRMIIPNNILVLKCSRLISRFCSLWPYYIKDVETIAFSCNQALLLNSVVCDNIFKYTSNNFLRFEESLPTTVWITESSDSTGSSEEVVLHSQETVLHHNKPTPIILSNLILIKSGYIYKIQIQQSPPDSCCTGGLYKSEVEIEPGTMVQFYDDPVVGKDEVSRGLISAVQFKNL